MTKGNGLPCKKCGTSAWYENSSCVECTRQCTRRHYEENKDAAYENSRRWKRENPEKDRASIKKWRQKNKKKVREQDRRWRAANQEKARKSVMNWHRENPERVKENIKRWHKKHPEKAIENRSRRRAKEKGNGGNYTAAEWIAIKKAQDYRCLACGKQEPEIKLTVDHVIPIDKGGRNDAENIQGLCGSCNSKKNTKTVDYRPESGILRWVQKKLFGD